PNHHCIRRLLFKPTWSIENQARSKGRQNTCSRTPPGLVNLTVMRLNCGPFRQVLPATIPVLAGLIALCRAFADSALSSSDLFGPSSAQGPAIYSFSPTQGPPVFTWVSIYGTNLNDATRVEFGGVSAIFNAMSATNLSAQVPREAVTG